MKRETFEQLVEEGIAALPDWVRKKMANVAVLIEDEPSREVRHAEELEDDETLLGYYHGIPLTKRDSGYGIGGTLPDTITLYQRPIEDEGRGDPERITEMVRDTVWHEVAHHFGIGEDQVRELESRRKPRKV